MIIGIRKRWHQLQQWLIFQQSAISNQKSSMPLGLPTTGNSDTQLQSIATDSAKSLQSLSTRVKWAIYPRWIKWAIFFFRKLKHRAHLSEQLKLSIVIVCHVQTVKTHLDSDPSASGKGRGTKKFKAFATSLADRSSSSSGFFSSSHNYVQLWRQIHLQ